MKINKIIYSSIYISIIALMSFTPWIGYIKIGPIFFTTIPVILVIATYHLGFYGSLSSSISFGLFSYLTSISINPSPLSDPILLIPSRIILGLCVYFIYKMLGNIKLWKTIILTILTIVLNTILITLFVFLVSLYNPIFDGTIYTWLSIIYLNFIVELIFGVILIINLYSLLYYLKKIYQMNKNNIWI